MGFRVSVSTCCVLFMWLAIGVMCSHGLAQEMSVPNINQQWNAANSAYADEEYAKATELGNKLVRELPFDPSLRIFLARCAAKMGQRETAIANLSKAADLGWEDAQQICENTEFRPLQASAEFERVVGRMTLNRHRPFLVYQSKSVLVDSECPLVVLFHGRGELPAIQLAFWKEAADEHGFAVLALKGVRRIGSVYSWEKEDATGTWEVDQEAILKKVVSGIEEVGKVRKISSVILAGFSQGSIAAIASLQRASDKRIRGAILFGSAFPPRREDLASFVGVSPELRISIHIGETDLWYPGNQKFFEQRRLVSENVRFRTWPGLDHQMPPKHTQVIGEALDWILETAE